MITTVDSLPIKYREKEFFLKKRYDIGNSNRTLLPEETLEKVRPYFPKIGLTRLGNVTGLDRVGIPVTIAIRANSYSLSQASGKAMNLQAALASAAMECIESYSAENIQQERIKASYQEIRQVYPVIAQEDLHLSLHSLFNVNRPEEWLLGWDIINQEQVAVPYHNVTLDFRVLSQAKCPGSFIMDSNGLASGNHFLEAVISGLYEVIERDSVSCHSEAQRYGHKKLTVNLDDVAEESIQELCHTIKSKDLVPMVFDCTTDVEVPTFEAYLLDMQSNLVPVAHGYGSHLNPNIGIMRALTEAVQARTLIVSGSRDDIFKDVYTANRIRHNSQLGKLENIQSDWLDFKYTNGCFPTFEQDINYLINQLQKVGLNRVIVLDLSPSDLDVSVVRVIVPGLEGYHYYGFRGKKRVKQFLSEYCKINPQSDFSANLIPKKQSTHLPAGGII